MSHIFHRLQTAITQDWRNAGVWFWLHFKAYCFLSNMKKYQRPGIKIEIVIVNRIKAFLPKKVQNRGLSDEWKHLKVKSYANLFKNCFYAIFRGKWVLSNWRFRSKYWIQLFKFWTNKTNDYRLQNDVKIKLVRFFNLELQPFEDDEKYVTLKKSWKSHVIF